MKKTLRIILGAAIAGGILASCGQPTGKVYNVYDYTSCRAEGGAIDNRTPPSCKIRGKVYTARVTRA